MDYVLFCGHTLKWCYSCLALCVVLLIAPAAGGQVKLFHCMVDLELPQQRVMDKYRIAEARLIDGRYIDPQKTGKIDSAFLVKSIQEIFPSAQAGGMGLLDLEDANYEALRGHEKQGGVRFEEGLQEMIKMVRIAKRLRPGVQWSVYNIPYATYYEKNDNWKTQYERLLPLIEMLDVLTPSLYDFYPDTTRFTDDATYFADNLRIALEIGQRTGKPVMPYIWHRWHDGNAKNGLLLIDIPEFRRNLRQMLGMRVGSTRIAGLIWFGAQSSFYRLKPELAALDRARVKARKGREKETVLDVYGAIIVNEASRAAN